MRRFCTAQHYRETRTDHYYYDKVLSDGSTSGTKVSFGKDGEDVPPQLWKRVWSLQLRLKSEEEFWKGLAGKTSAKRATRMKIVDRGTEVVDRLTQWAAEHQMIRALLLESSRANPQASIDILSDYDMLLIVSDIDWFVDDEGWLQDFGTPLVRFRDKDPIHGLEQHTRLVLYDDGTKIDYTIWPMALLQRILAEPNLPDLLDLGYQILVDKDDVARRLLAPTYTAHIPSKPTEKVFHALVEEFWWESIYVAKNLWRDELIHAKYNLECVMKHELLRTLLEWRIEIDHNWSLKPGATGRGLRNLLDRETWSELAETYVGADTEENWEALFKTTALFRRIAVDVAHALGYDYPRELDDRVTEYLQTVRTLEK